jgi:hypothetical protein
MSRVMTYEEMMDVGCWFLVVTVSCDVRGDLPYAELGLVRPR